MNWGRALSVAPIPDFPADAAPAKPISSPGPIAPPGPILIPSTGSISIGVLLHTLHIVVNPHLSK